jgi:hypothetical protein
LVTLLWLAADIRQLELGASYSSCLSTTTFDGITFSAGGDGFLNELGDNCGLKLSLSKSTLQPDQPQTIRFSEFMLQLVAFG